MVNDFVKNKVLSANLGLTSKQTEDLILSLSETYEKYSDTDLDTILKGIKKRDIYYSSWVLHLDVMN